MSKSSLIPSRLTLWSFQNPAVWQLLRAGKTVRAKDELCWPTTTAQEPYASEESLEKLRNAYDWMAERLDHKDPRPDVTVRWPMWAYWCIGSCGPKKPDLREFRQYQPGVMLEIAVDSSRVLLSDHSGWHAALNDTYNGRGWDRFMEEWERSEPGSLHRRRLEVVKRKSWRRCLAVNPAFPVQAVLWELRPNDVVSHRMYKGHRPHSTVRGAGQTASIH